jgi:plastocyanin
MKMSVPRILLAVPLLVAGILLPAAGADLKKPAAGAVGMEHEGFSSKVVTIRRGRAITFDNDSRWIHIIGPGRGGHLAHPGAHPGVEPVPGLVIMEQNDVFTTGRWNTPGTYYLTCSVHPEMTTKIVVTP